MITYLAGVGQGPQYITVTFSLSIRYKAPWWEGHKAPWGGGLSWVTK